MRVNLKGVHQVQCTLATGERVKYYYAWRCGPRLVGEPGSPEFIRSYEAAHQNQRSPDPSLFRSVIVAYLKSRAFTPTTADPIRLPSSKRRSETCLLSESIS